MTLNNLLDWLRENIIIFANWLTEVLLEFFELFLWEKDWLDGNIFILLMVIAVYLVIAGVFLGIAHVLVIALQHYGKYLFNSEYRKKTNEQNKLAKEADRNLRKIEDEEEEKVIQARKAELGFFGKILYFVQRHLLGSLFILFLILLFLSCYSISRFFLSFHCGLFSRAFFL